MCWCKHSCLTTCLTVAWKRKLTFLEKQQFALTEMAYTCVRILQRYDKLARRWTDDDNMIKSEIVLSPKNGVKVAFWEADGTERRL